MLRRHFAYKFCWSHQETERVTAMKNVFLSVITWCWFHGALVCMGLKKLILPSLQLILLVSLTSKPITINSKHSNSGHRKCSHGLTVYTCVELRPFINIRTPFRTSSPCKSGLSNDKLSRLSDRNVVCAINPHSIRRRGGHSAPRSTDLASENWSSGRGHRDLSCA